MAPYFSLDEESSYRFSTLRAAYSDPGYLDRSIVDYWDERASGYSAGVMDEMQAPKQTAWLNVLQRETEDACNAAKSVGRAPRALDLGCGPGFFSILLADLGCRVDAVDSSLEMLSKARTNVLKLGASKSIEFHHRDVSDLAFKEESFDIIALRNVTWLMREPEKSYAYWKTLLKENGIMLVFDANWYKYLRDTSIDAKRVSDQKDRTLLGWSDEAICSVEHEVRCEAIASHLPLTYVDRPMWDVSVLHNLGFSYVSADTDIWKELWDAGESEYYATSPMFMVKASK